MKTSILRLVLCAAATLLLVTPAQAQMMHAVSPDVSPDLRAELDGLLLDYELYELEPQAIAARVAQGEPVRLRLGARTLDLVLEINDLRGPGYQEVEMGLDGLKVVEPQPVSTYKGHLVDDPAAVVRVQILEDRFEGYVWTAEEWLFIDAADKYEHGFNSRHVVVYNENDVREEALGLCGAGELRHHAKSFQLPTLDLFAINRIDQGLDSATSNGLVQVATEGDNELYSRYGNPGAYNFMSARINSVDGIYQNQLSIGISQVFNGLWTSTDPYNSTNASTTLSQQRVWWNANMGGTARDTVHQFSGKNMNGGTIGIAYVGVICNAPSYAYGISEDQRNNGLNAKLTTHELGHNLSANHDDQIGCATCNGSGPIMCSFIQGSGPNSFSSCSRSAILGHASRYSCI